MLTPTLFRRSNNYMQTVVCEGTNESNKCVELGKLLQQKKIQLVLSKRKGTSAESPRYVAGIIARLGFTPSNERIFLWRLVHFWLRAITKGNELHPMKGWSSCRKLVCAGFESIEQALDHVTCRITLLTIVTANPIAPRLSLDFAAHATHIVDDIHKH